MINRARQAKRAFRPISLDQHKGTNCVAGRPIPRSQAQGGQVSAPIPLEDAQLIERIKAGQTEAYGALVQKYQDRVFNTCWRICGHLEDARDLTQEAFLKAFEKLEGFRHESGFYTWLFRIAVNLARTHRRNSARRRTVSLDGGPEVAGTQAENLARHVPDGATEGPDRSATRAELQGTVARALLALDDDFRAVVVLRDIEGFDYQEIAMILEVPPGTVKSRLHRARAALAEAIRPALSQDD